MNRGRQNQYQPDFVTPPGETLKETLDAIGMTQTELAKRMGRPLKTINEIISGKAAITADTALQLERVFGVPANFWNNREYQYREALARIAEEERLSRCRDWLQRFPIAAMIRLGWIQRHPDGVQQLQELLNFFGVASPDQWTGLWQAPDAAYRRSTVFNSQPEAVSAWLRKGEIATQRIQCAPYDAKRFTRVLQQIRSLTRTPPRHYLAQLPRLCADAGVAVVFVPCLAGAPVNGATRWLTPEKALLQLSFRYKSDDSFWFSFFHEAGHIVRHGKRAVFIEGGEIACDLEHEADLFARDMLIPPAEYEQLLAALPSGHLNIERLAERIGISPGIVVGRLQKDGRLPCGHGNKLKQSVDFGMLASA